MNKVKIILLLSFMGLSVSCTRAQKEAPGQVQVQLPAVEKVSSSSYVALSDDNPDDDNLDWSSDIPDGLYKDANATKKINCYGIMAGGPEPEMQINKCGRQDNSTKLIRYVEGADYNFKVGKWAGAVYASANATLSLEIPPGVSRNLYLIGFYAKDAASCVDLKVADPDTSGMSRPYLIAKATGVNIPAGATVPVSMTMAFDANLWFDSCDFGDDNKTAMPIATRVEVRKEGFPENSLLKDQLCEYIDVSLSDDAGRPGVLATSANDTVFTLVNTTPSPAITGGTYASLDACENSLLSSTFSIPAGQSRVRRWIRTGFGNSLGITTGVASTVNLRVVPTSTSANAVPVASVGQNIKVLDPMMTQYQIVGPRLAKSGEKYLLHVVPRRNSGLFLKKDGTMDHSIYLVGNNNVKLYSTTSCTGGGGNTLVVPAVVAEMAYFTFCAEFNDGITDITMQHTGSGYYRNAVTLETAPTPMNGAFRVETRGGSDSIQRLRVVGDNQITLPGTGDKCYGPFYIVAENEFGAVMLNKSSASVPLSISYSLGNAGTVSPLQIFRAPSTAALLPCDANDNISANPVVNIGAGDSATKFFIKALSTTQIGIERELEIKNSDGTLKAKYKLFVD